MKTNLILASLAISLLSSSVAMAQSQEFNSRRHLDPEMQAKVNTSMARTFRDSAQGGSGSRLNRRIENVGCGGLSVGDYSDSKNPPKEVIIVADSIINIAKNCN